jgi:preprotein translocase subunit SecF
MEFFTPGSLKIDFMGKRNLWMTISACLVTLSLVVIVWRQLSGTLNWGVDFAGGTVIELEFKKEVPIEQVRKAVEQLGYEKSVIQHAFFAGKEGQVEYMIRVERIAILSDTDKVALETGLKEKFGQRLTFIRFDPDAGDQFELTFAKPTDEIEVQNTLMGQAQKLNKPELANIKVRKEGKESEQRYNVLMTGVATQIENELKKKFAQEEPSVRKVEFVGPQVGKKLRNDGILSLVYALLGILVYVGFRFNVLFSPGAVIALFHDVIITTGIAALFRIEFNLTFVAAILTIVGYSINDTIVIYDRIRENIARFKAQPLDKQMNIALNETLSRTINTSLVTFLSLMGLLFMGFGEIREFAIVMGIGIVFGTYSSIYVASALTQVFDTWMKKIKPA